MPERPTCTVEDCDRPQYLEGKCIDHFKSMDRPQRSESTVVVHEPAAAVPPRDKMQRPVKKPTKKAAKKA